MFVYASCEREQREKGCKRNDVYLNVFCDNVCVCVCVRECGVVLKKMTHTKVER